MKGLFRYNMLMQLLVELTSSRLSSHDFRAQASEHNAIEVGCIVVLMLDA